MSKDTNRLLGHADEADGIEEYDNPLPDWWTGLFWLCIIWAVAYTVHYHFIADRSQEKALAAEMAAAQERWPAQQVSAASFSFAADAIAAGEAVFAQNCVVCHTAELTGSIGPNLVDAEWIHGGTAEDVVRTVTEGVPAMGMLAWGPILSPEQINQVSAYVLSKNAEALGLPLESYLSDQGETEESVGGETEPPESGTQ